ncbi:nitrilase-related carbon-nitrogen hydrolase [Sphingomonas crocodyli]|uniref:Nitrilase n=1 Tax=Sphingomonas crocodyli TaxID=1979270 RepID=A0A437M058_9SPHN|nr:nitrilase-related carbon-nitrogen hydrolase [Sphingomonas crocodyli]RVT90983.1 nitrilase [Sphingomonas crocodyli]
MTIKPWRAHCIQTLNYVVNDVSTREDAQAIVQKSLDRWEKLIASTVGRSQGGMRNLVLFPEFALTGFPIQETAAEWIEKACIQIPGPETERLQKMAQQYGIFIGANAYEYDPQWPGRYFNCCFLIDPSGDVILKYKRVNTVHSPSPHDFMDRYFDHYGIEGAFPVVKTELGNIGMFPCGEIMYPEAARVLLMRGAEVILHPTSDHGVGDFIGWEQCKRARAAENMVYLVSTNSGGMMGSPAGGNIMGNSKIIDYNGLVLSNTGGPGESNRASAIIDVQTLRMVRQELGPLNRIARQRTEMYMRVFNEASFYPPNSFVDKPMGSKAEVNGIQRATMDRLAAKGIIPLP